MTATATRTPVQIVTSLGNRTTRLASDVTATAAAIIDAVGPEHDWTKRGAKPAAVHAWAVPAGESVPDQKDANKKPTAYGVGVDTLVHAITRLLVSEDTDKPVAMRVSMTGAGSAVVPTDHPAYALLLALLGADESADQDESAESDQS